MNIAAKKNTWEEDMAKNIKFSPDVKVRTKEYKIGCIGAGMIMAECHLAAYKEAGFPVIAIASRTKANAEKVAKRWGIPVVHATPEDSCSSGTEGCQGPPRTLVAFDSLE